jgi:hypothetical protein
MSPKLLQELDTYFLYSPLMIELYKQSYPETSPVEYESKLVVVGNPLLDQLPEIKKINRMEIFRKYGLDPSKKVVIYLTQALQSRFWLDHIFLQNNRWQSLVHCLKNGRFDLMKKAWTDPHYFDLMTFTKKWCQINNASLVIKSRSKLKEPSWLIQMADAHVEETNQWYPYPPLELISIADLIISMHSTAVLEAAATGTFGLNIHLPDYLDTNALTWRFFKRPALFKYPGVNDSWLHSEFKDRLSKHALVDFKVNPKQCTAFVKEYLGYDDNQSSGRIFKYLFHD